VTLLRQGVGLDDPQRSLPAPNLLCDSVKYWGQFICEHLSMLCEALT